MKERTILIIVALTFLLFPGFVYSAIPASERAALIAFYRSTGGDHWPNSLGWKTAPLHTDGFAMPGTEGNWHGVTLSGDNVTQLCLGYNYLYGNIPSELCNLSKLTQLCLNHNQLRGSIPSQLLNLSNLENLDLSENQLSGSIPSQLDNLNNLKTLILWDNQLSGSIPPELGNLSNLESLRLGLNPLSGSIPPELGNLNNLESLYLGNNHLSGSIPPELGNLNNLESLHLGNNQLSGSIPPELGNLNNLEGLWLFSNQLNGSIPSQLGNLSSLIYLSLGENQLSGSIPPELGNLNNLESLWMYYNQLSGSIPPELGNLKLAALSLDHNQLSGKIPSSFKNLVKYNYFFLDISYNCLFTTDSELISLLNKYEPDWEATQCLEKAPPFGYFETPIHGSIVCSSIPITGWALDDFGMCSVKIYREQEKNLVFIGDAIFVEGARPDVEATYPGYPESDSAGWGYILLTNTLPNGGNGTYVLHAIATDRAGKTTILGTKTIIVDNAHAVKPFGAIDTPIQGGTVSCSRFINWGWVLTPPPNKIPTDGSTIDVWIDGVKTGHPTYNLYRSDIASLFPNYTNSNGAVGYFYLDITGYWDGVHTIQWTAVDNAGNIDGIGSRYFRSFNKPPDYASAAASPLSGLGRHTGQIPGRSRYDEKIGELLPVKGNIHRHTIKELALLPEEKGMNELIIRELERVEIKLGENYSEILGYLLCSDELKKLPIGSTLDAKTGTFYWSPGPGFLGRYSLVFVLTDSNGQSFKKFIQIKIEPKFNGYNRK
jgi:Leucine-rich repeat (LRR) protein